jgi:predicted Zn-dependent protease
MEKKLFRLSLIATLFFFVIACARNPVTGKKEVMLMSNAQEIALGQQSDPQIVASYGLYPDSTLQRFISEKGKEMGAICHRNDLDYQFRVLDSPVVNAFAVPGGYVYFTRGILGHFNNEAEFAGVLGHEIGHVAARHSAKQYTKATFAQLGLVLGIALSSEFRKFSDLAQTSLSLLFLKFGRDMESQSDQLGVEYSTKIGYDAHEMAQFFKTLDRMRDGTEAGAIPTFLSTHPDPADRKNKVHAAADEWQQKDPANNYNVNRNSYLRMIDGLIYGEDPRQGYVQNSKFYHPEMLFQFPIPQGWKTINTPSAVQMGPADGQAVMILTLAKENNLQDAARAVVSTDNLTILESENRTVNGNSAIVMVSTDEEKTIKVLSYLIQYNGLIYKFHGLSKPETFNSYFNLFTNTMKNFRKLTDQSKINVVPEKIKVVSVPSSGSFLNAVKAHNMPDNKFQELSLINGMTMEEQVKAGSLIKILVK